MSLSFDQIRKIISENKTKKKAKFNFGNGKKKVKETQINESNSFSGVVFHGSGSKFRKFEQSKARILNDFYGGGVAYFTDNREVARTYAKSMAKKKKSDPIIYTVQLNLKKVFDVNDVFTGKDLIKILPDNVDKFARGAGLLNWKSDQYKVIGDLKSGKMKLTGDQVFKGLSQGMNQTATARKHLMSLGYDGLRYNGGDNMGMATKHNVYLVYDASDIEIQQRQLVVSKK